MGGRLRHGQCIAVESAGNLPCKYVLNTNAPGRSNPDTLRQCYDSAIEKAIEVRDAVFELMNSYGVKKVIFS